MKLFRRTPDLATCVIAFADLYNDPALAKAHKVLDREFDRFVALGSRARIEDVERARDLALMNVDAMGWAS